MKHYLDVKMMPIYFITAIITCRNKRLISTNMYKDIDKIVKEHLDLL